MHVKTKLAGPSTYRPLTKQEIDRRIDSLGAELVGPVMDCSEADAEAMFRPRWISAAELIRRVEPFLGEN